MIYLIDKDWVKIGGVLHHVEGTSLRIDTEDEAAEKRIRELFITPKVAANRAEVEVLRLPAQAALARLKKLGRVPAAEQGVDTEGFIDLARVGLAVRGEKYVTLTPMGLRV